MRFRLTYEGDLLSHKPFDPAGNDKRAAHKHAIRRHFHKQLKEQWRTNRFLSNQKIASGAHQIMPPSAAAFWEKDPGGIYPLSEVLAECYGHSGYRFIPLVWKEMSLSCSLRILCLRRDALEAVSAARDIDNRIKTVIDALTVVPLKHGSPIGEDGKPLAPSADEDPMYVLLDDDRQITHLEIETDTALAPDPTNEANESFVRLVISVEIRPYTVTQFNLSFG